MFDFKLNKDEFHIDKNRKIITEEGFQRYIDEKIKQGYITEDGEPLKCTECDSKEFKTINEYYLDDCSGTRCEYTVKCKECGHVVGYWAYGYWELI